MPEIIVKVTGMTEAREVLDRIDTGLSDGQLVGKVAAIVQAQAQKNALSGHGTHEGGYPNAPSGRMASSIATQVTGLYTAVVGPSAYYAPFVEFGHRQTPGRFVSQIRKRLVRSFAPAYPFMRPAVEQTRDKISTFVHDFIDKLIRGAK